MRTDGVHCRESTGTGPALLKVVPVTGASFLGMTMTMDQLMRATLFPRPFLVYTILYTILYYTVLYYNVL